MTPDAVDLRTELLAISAELGRGTLSSRSASAPPRPAAPDATSLVEPLRDVLLSQPVESWPRLAISFNADQVDSKLWLIECLPRGLDLSRHRVVILGAWFGLLALMLHRLAPRPPAEIVCVDIDAGVCARATQVLSVLPEPPRVLAADVLDLDYPALGAGRPTLFVNTSCEHLHDFAGWRNRIPAGARLVLQSNDHAGCSEHVNWVPDLEAFEAQARLSEVAFRGTLPLEHFRRFMLIGRT
ncbi:MAG TPA: hypothetical protein PLH72_03470 [Vicinamibacterales bacterium]|nr:hypothetical protein [Vicinamibacterales bacterium]